MDGMTVLWIVLAAALVLLIIGGVVMMRRRDNEREEFEREREALAKAAQATKHEAIADEVDARARKAAADRGGHASVPGAAR